MPSQAVPSLWGIPSLQRYMRHPRGLARRPPSRRLNSGPFSHCYGRAESQGMRSHGYSTNGGRVRFFRDIASVTMDLNGVERIDFHALGGADNIVINDLSGTDLPAGGLLRNSKTGGFEVYDISNNNITNAGLLGNVGLDWQVMGFGNFSSRGETDMILRNANNGGVEVYDISNNELTGAAPMGAVGLDWQFSGIGNFSGGGESDMLLRNSNTGGLEVYDIANNAITNAAFIGAVGLDWKFSGVGNFSGVPGETDLLLRNNTTGGLELYDISNNQLTGAAFIGAVGLDWQFAGIGPVQGAGESDLVLRNKNSGAFEVYDIANNQLTGAAPLGAVGLDWQLGGFAIDPPSGAMGDSSQVLAQAMAGFGGSSGATDSLNDSPLGANTSHQTFRAPPHA